MGSYASECGHCRGACKGLQVARFDFDLAYILDLLKIYDDCR